MPDTTISAVDKSLEVLLQAEKELPGYSLSPHASSTLALLMFSYTEKCKWR